MVLESISERGIEVYICHYCEEEIKENQELSRMKNNKTGQVIYLHYPDCKVRFTTFHKTKKEFEKWRENRYQ